MKLVLGCVIRVINVTRAVLSRQSLATDSPYEAFVSDAGIDGNSDFDVNAIWCAVGSPAPDYSYDGVGKSCLSYSFPSAKWAPASTFGFTDMGTVPGPDGDAESIFNQF